MEPNQVNIAPLISDEIGKESVPAKKRAGFIRRILSLRFSIKALLILITLFAIGFTYVSRFRNLNQAVERINQAGGRIVYFEKDEKSIGKLEKWLRIRLPQCYFDSVKSVDFESDVIMAQLSLGIEQFKARALLAQLERKKKPKQPDDSTEFLPVPEEADHVFLRDEVPSYWRENQSASALHPSAQSRAAEILGLKDTVSEFSPQNRLAALEGLSEFHSIEVFSYKGTEFNDESLKRFANLISLERLFLNGTQVGDTGLAHLSGLSSVEELDLEGTLVADSGMEHLTNLKSLRKLDLNGTQVTDSGLKQLETMKSLRTITLGRGVTAKGVKEFKKALPECFVYW